MHYQEELGGRELKRVFKRFASIQNRILIDYKALKEYLVKRVTEMQQANNNLKEFMDRVQGQEEMQSRSASQNDKISQLSHHSLTSAAAMIHRKRTRAALEQD
jgi:hypothetical protein